MVLRVLAQLQSIFYGESLINSQVLLVLRVGWFLAMLSVTVLALMPVEHLQLPLFNWWDKAQHVLAFAVLTTWALLAWPSMTVVVLVGMLAFGAFIELAQWWVGYRFADWADWLADVVGVCLAWAAVYSARAWGRKLRG
jgi:VanZ family protein